MAPRIRFVVAVMVLVLLVVLGLTAVVMVWATDLVMVRLLMAAIQVGGHSEGLHSTTGEQPPKSKTATREKKTHSEEHYTHRD